MFGMIKNIAAGGALESLVERYGSEIKQKLQEVLGAVDNAVINDDPTFTDKVSTPVRVAVVASAGGATSLVSNFDKRFDVAMLHLRDELIVTDGTRPALVDDFDRRLPEVIKTGFAKVIE